MMEKRIALIRLPLRALEPLVRSNHPLPPRGARVHAATRNREGLVDAARGPLEELHTQARLEPGDATARRGEGEVRLRGGLGDGARLRDAAEEREGGEVGRVRSRHGGGTP